MERVGILPGSVEEWLEMRKADITSTDCSALMRKPGYKTYYELWHEKHSGVLKEFKTNDRVEAGKHLESGIASFIAEKFELGRFSDFAEYIRIPEYRMGSSFDFILNSGEIYEIKSVDQWSFRDDWMDADEITVMPERVELQVQHQMLVSGINNIVIGALVGGNDPHVFRRSADIRLHDKIRAAAAMFWDGDEPDPDYDNDADAVSRVHGHAEPGKIIDLDSDMVPLLEQYIMAGRDERKAKDAKKVAKAKILAFIGDAEKAKGHGYSISAGLVGPKTVTVDRGGYRNFRVYHRG